MRDIGQNQGELVAAEARDDVAGPHAGLQARRDLLQQFVAHVMAEGVVNVLEAVEIEEQHRHQPLAAVGLLHGPQQVVVQLLAVRQAGQGVEVGEITQALLRLPVFRDILDGTDHAHRPAGFIEGDLGLFVHDALGAVGPHDAVIHAVRLFFLQGSVDRVLDGLTVVRMHRLKERLIGRGELLRREPEDAVDFIGPAQFVGGDVPVPAAEMRDALGVCQTGRALAQHPFRLAHGREVTDDHEHTGGGIGRVANGAHDDFDRTPRGIVRILGFHDDVAIAPRMARLTDATGLRFAPWMHDGSNVTSDRLVGAQAGELIKRPVGADDPVVGVNQVHGVFDEVHRIRPLGGGPGERLLHAPALGDVLGDAQQVKRLPRFIQDRDFLGVQEAHAVVLRVNRLFGNVVRHALAQDIPVLGGEKVRFLPGEEVVIALAEHLVAGKTEQILGGLVEAHEPEILGVLDKQHVGEILDHGVEEYLHAPVFIFRQHAPGNVLAGGDEMRDVALLVFQRCDGFFLVIQRAVLLAVG